MLEIDGAYPNIRMVVAHIGRAYTVGNLGGSLEKLGDTSICFLIFREHERRGDRPRAGRAGQRAHAFWQRPSADPYTHEARLRGDRYINLISNTERPAIAESPNIRRVKRAENYTFYLYESLYAFKKAAEAWGLTAGR